ncbi:MAG: hypothetical protein FWH03_04545 [Firmicutes bacterium]|nr:hypothetical protein [Bacillota bacterium]
MNRHDTNLIFKKIEEAPYLCKMCNLWEVPHRHEICRVCGWQDDSIQYNNPDYEDMPNKVSYNQYKNIWETHKDEIMRLKTGKGRFIREILYNAHPEVMQALQKLRKPEAPS